MGLLHDLLGVEVIPTRDGIFLSQHKYVHELLANTNMSGAKDVSTPLSTSTPLQLVDGIALVASRILTCYWKSSISFLDTSGYFFYCQQVITIHAQAHVNLLDCNKTTSQIFEIDYLPWHSAKKNLEV